jgi:hypothetical protein
VTGFPCLSSLSIAPSSSLPLHWTTRLCDCGAQKHTSKLNTRLNTQRGSKYCVTASWPASSSATSCLSGIAIQLLRSHLPREDGLSRNSWLLALFSSTKKISTSRRLPSQLQGVCHYHAEVEEIDSHMQVVVHVWAWQLRKRNYNRRRRVSPCGRSILLTCVAFPVAGVRRRRGQDWKTRFTDLKARQQGFKTSSSPLKMS